MVPLNLSDFVSCLVRVLSSLIPSTTCIGRSITWIQIHGLRTSRFYIEMKKLKQKEKYIYSQWFVLLTMLHCEITKFSVVAPNVFEGMFDRIESHSLETSNLFAMFQHGSLLFPLILHLLTLSICKICIYDDTCIYSNH